MEYHTYEKFLFKREMKKRVFVILTYDVNQKRVGKVCKVCKKYLHHVQKSVFEGEITEARLKQLKRGVGIFDNKRKQSWSRRNVYV